MAPPPAGRGRVRLVASPAYHDLRRKLFEHIHRYEQLKEISRAGCDIMFGFAVGLLVLMVLFYLWPHQSNHAVTVSVPLVCKAANLHYAETETSYASTACSTSAHSEPPSREDASLCAGLGANQTCYSQQVFYQREKRVVTINLELGSKITKEELIHCADVIRKYWYVCDGNRSSGEEYAKVEHFHNSVLLTTYKVFHCQDLHENQAVSEDKKAGTVEAGSEN